MSIADDIAGVFDTLAGLDLAASIVLTTVEVGGDYDLTTSTRALTTADYPVVGSVSKCTKALRAGVDLVEGDILVAIPAQGLAVEPEAGDRVTVSGVVYAVVAVDITRPGATAILYELQARRVRA